MMEFFIVVAAAASSPAQYIGPLTEEKCHVVRQALQDVGAECKRAIGMRICGDAGGRFVSACPMFEGDMVETGRRQ